MKTELNPCPFCGGEARSTMYDPYDGYQGNCTRYVVQCSNCGAKIEHSKMQVAIEKWNRRVNDDT